MQQLISLWNTFKDLDKQVENLKWGDEMEYHVFSINEDEKIASIWAEGFEDVNELLKTDPIEGFEF